MRDDQEMKALLMVAMLSLACGVHMHLLQQMGEEQR